MMLLDAIRAYVERKRSFGLAYDMPAREFASFAKHVGNLPLNSIVVRHMASHLDRPRGATSTWRGKYHQLRKFFEYWAARGVIDTLPLPPIRPAVPQTFVPYIYQKTEIQALLKGTRRCQRGDSCVFGARTFRMLLLFLYSTGALTGEALRLRKEDLDLKADFVTIGGSRFNRVRRIPIGPDLHSRLDQYMRWISRRRIQGPTLFANKDGSPINTITMRKCFKRLRRLTGVLRHDGSYYQARMHDLRHTFAVHPVTSWLKQGADMNRMLPALAAYMGEVGLGSTERYLSIAPERFRKHLAKLSPQRRRKHWRDDPALMKILDEL